MTLGSGHIRPPGGAVVLAPVPEGLWFEVPGGVDDVTTAAVLNPGGAAWRRCSSRASWFPVRRSWCWSDRDLGADCRSAGRPRGARVVVAGRNQRVLDELVAAGAEAAIRVDRTREDLVRAITAAAPLGPRRRPSVAPTRGGGARSTPASEERSRGGRGGCCRDDGGEVAGVPRRGAEKSPHRADRQRDQGPGVAGERVQGLTTVLGLIATGAIGLSVDAVPLAEERTWPPASGGRRTADRPRPGRGPVAWPARGDYPPAPPESQVSTAYRRMRSSATGKPTPGRSGTGIVPSPLMSKVGSTRSSA